MPRRRPFQIPDRPAARPSARALWSLVRTYYERPGNEAGGRLHVVLDDGNDGDEFLREALADCLADGDVLGADIARQMLLTRTQRRQVRAFWWRYRTVLG